MGTKKKNIKITEIEPSADAETLAKHITDNDFWEPIEGEAEQEEDGIVEEIYSKKKAPKRRPRLKEFAGVIRPRKIYCERCIEKRDEKVILDENENDWRCPECTQIAKAYYIFLYHQGEKYRIGRDQDGHVLDTFKRAEILLHAIRKDIDKNTFSISNYLPKEIEQFRGKALLEKWQKVKEGEESEGLSGWYITKIKEYIKNHYMPFFQDKLMRDLQFADIEDFKTQLPEHLSPKTKKNILDTLKTFTKWLCKRNVIAKVPEFPAISVEEKPIKWITKENQLKLLSYIPDNHKAIFQFLMYHPVRPSEAMALQRKHFDTEIGVIEISQAFGFHAKLKSRKNKKPYNLPISKHFDLKILKNKLPEAYVFTYGQGRNYSINYLGEVWREAFEKARKNGVIIPYINIYNATRHSIASQAIRKSVALERISKALGHSNLEITRRKYASMGIEVLQDIVDDNDFGATKGATMVQKSKKRISK